MFNISVSGACCALIMLAGSAFAVEVDVHSGQPQIAGSRYQSIEAALDYVKTQPAPRVINITGGGPYYESFAINYSITIRGDNYRPLIITHPGTGMMPGALDNAGIAFYTDADYVGPQAFRLENMAIIPNIWSTPGHCLGTINDVPEVGLTNEVMTLELDGVLISANNGSQQPASESGLEPEDFSAGARFQITAVDIRGRTNVSVENTVITHAVFGINFVVNTPGHTLDIGPDTVLSYFDSGAIYTRAGGILTASGTRAQPIIIKGCGPGPGSTPTGAISFLGGDNEQTIPHSLESVIFMENQGVSLLCRAYGSESFGSMELKRCAFVNNHDTAIQLSIKVLGTWTIRNCTFVGTGGDNSIMSFDQVSSPLITPIDFIDCVIAGNGESDPANRIFISQPYLAMTFTNCGFPMTGPHALEFGIFTPENGAPMPTLIDAQFVDPEFVLVSSDFSHPDFLDVKAHNHANAASDGTHLSGYGDYILTSAIGDWNIY